MSHEYILTGGGLTIVNAEVTLAFINPAAAPSAGIEILRCWVSQSTNATSAQQRVRMSTQVTAFPTLVSTTPAKAKQGDAVSVIAGGTAGAAGTCGINASAEGAGAKTAIMQDAFNVLNGFLWVPTPPETIVMPAGFASGFGFGFPVAITNAQTANWQVGVVFREI